MSARCRRHHFRMRDALEKQVDAFYGKETAL
jgi:hypothetical protein